MVLGQFYPKPYNKIQYMHYIKKKVFQKTINKHHHLRDIFENTSAFKNKRYGPDALSSFVDEAVCVVSLTPNTMSMMVT